MLKLTRVLALLLVPLLGSAIHAAPIRNTSRGTVSGATLDLARATVNLERSGSAVTSALAEITPNAVVLGRAATPFVYDLRPTLGPGDSGVRVVEITAPTGYGGCAVQGVAVSGIDLVASCPAPGAGEYCATIAGELMTVTFGANVTTDQVPIKIRFTATTPATAGTGDFPSSVRDAAAPQPTTPGDANADPADANSITVDVRQTQGLVLTLNKTAARNEAVIGDVVTYAVAIRNSVDRDIAEVHVEDRIPPGFKYLAGSARLDEVPLADPVGDQTLDFDIGLVPALADGNGNGVADPGEPGYRTLVYRLVVGSGATPGEYRNTAVAIDICPSCRISNESSDTVEVRLDPLFDLGTVIGKVFDDANEDGEQQADEPGVSDAMVALDDGTYALTDEYGRYHFPAIRPGHRLVKLNLQSLTPGTRATTEESRIVSVTPGLLVRASFGVVVRRDVESIGEAPSASLAIEGRERIEPVSVVGSVESLSLLINGNRVVLPQVDVELAVDVVDDTLHVVGGKLEPPAQFVPSIGRGDDVSRWSLTIADGRAATVRRIEGVGAPPAAIEWDGRNDNGELVAAGEIYVYQFAATLADGTAVSSRQRLIGIDRQAVVAVRLTGEAFASGEAELSPRARQVLDEVAGLLDRAPEELVVVEGHTDSVGSNESNQELSRRRASAAVDYLCQRHGLRQDRFVLQWYGEERPVASNVIEEGRAVNRRVEVRGDVDEGPMVEVLDQARVAPSVAVNGRTLAVGDYGRFETAVDDRAADAVEVAMTGSTGAAAMTRITLPSISELTPSGIHAVPEGGTAGPCAASGQGKVICRVGGRTDPGNTIEVDGRAVAVGPDGVFATDAALGVGRTTLGILATNADGRVRIATLEITVADRDADGRLIVESTGVPSLTVNLPPRGLKLTSSALDITGLTDPGNTLVVNGASVPVQADGRFTTRVELPAGRSTLGLEVRDAAGRTGKIEREIEVAKSQLFLVAFADGKVGQLQGRGYIEGAGLEEKDETYSEGRLAFYLKGRIAGKYLITSAFDSAKQDAGQLFGSVDRQTADRLLTELDPDKLYPVYGDSSTLVYDVESQGKFYLALDSDALHAVIGNFPIALSDTELASYQRTLYGGRVVYRSVSSSKYGDPDTFVTLFGAEVQQARVRDELRATGGSLYYLSHRDLIEGSEEVALVVRDKLTDLVLSRTRQSRGVDYTIKYPEGRVIFQRPISSVVAGGSIFDSGVLPGNPVVIEVGYETALDGFEKTASVGRVRQQIGDQLAVGGTYIDDEMRAGRFELSGGDVELRLREGTRIVAEFAESQGSAATTFTSDDGGLSYTEAPVDARSEGSAVKLAAEIDLGEWFDRPGKYRFRAYFKDQDAGFDSHGNQVYRDGDVVEHGVRKIGFGGTIRPFDRDSLSFRYEREERTGALAPADLSQNSTGAVQWNHDRPRWGLAAELLQNDSETASGVSNGNSAFGSIRAWAKLAESLTGQLQHQQTLSGPTDDQTSATLRYQALPSLGFEFRGTQGTRGHSAEAGAILDIGESSVYVTERVADDPAGERTTTVLGARSPIGAATKVYTEYQWESAERGDRAISLVGLQRQWEVKKGFRFLLSGETAKIDAEPSTTRTAVAGSMTYGHPDGTTFVTRDELRRESGERDRTQIFTLNELNYKLGTDLSLLARWRYSTTLDRQTDADEAAFEERVIGLAYRPVAHDRFNLLGRYTQLSDQRPVGPADSLARERTAEAFSLDGIYAVTSNLEWVFKLALRDQSEREGDLPRTDSRSHLAIQRANWLFWRRFELGAEYRLLAQDLADDRRQGWLGELMWRPAKHFRFGVGYNFTDFSDNELSANDYSTRGWFLRAQGRF